MARIGAFTVPLDGEQLTARILVNRAYGELDNPYDAALLWRGAPGARAPSEPEPTARLGAAAADAVEDEAFPGLRRLLEAHPYTRYEQLDAETADAAARCLPFEHVALSTRGAGQQMQTVENNLRRAFDQAYGALAARPPRFEFFDDPLAPESVRVRVQFGFGVFLPEDDARPEGGIDVAPASPRDETPGDWEPLRLGGAASDRPAALYRGQSGLAFSSALRHAPAVAPPGVLPEDHVFFYGRYSSEDAPAFRILPVGAAALEPTPRFYAQDLASETEGPLAGVRDALGPADGGVAVRGPTGRVEFFCRLRFNDRAGALTPRPVLDRPHFSFEGLILPDTGAFLGLREWWVDFTRAGRLSVAPLDERAWAVASGPHGRLGGGSGGVARLYNRAKHDEAGLFDEGDELRLGARQTLFRRGLRYPGDAPDAARRLWRLRLQARYALGYVALQRAERQFVTPRRSDEDTALSLDWLDACGGVSLPGRTLSGAPRTEGLASWSLAGAGVRLRRLPDAEIELTADRSMAVARIVDGDLLVPFQPGEAARFKRGDELVIGCHHFRYQSAAAEF